MNKKKYVLMAMVIIGIILGCCLPVVNAELINDLGTVEYMNSLQVDIDCNESMDLYFVTSNWSSDDLVVTNYGFNPLINKTRFLFTSQYIEPEWYMIPGFISYLYQDNITGQIYRVYVNYSSLKIPLTSLELELIGILGEYIDMGNNTLELCNVTRNLLHDFYWEIQNKNDTLGNTTLLLNQLINDYYNLSDNYNLSIIEVQDLTDNMTSSIMSYDLLNESYNTTFSNWLQSSGLADKYMGVFDDLTESNLDFIWFNGEQYKTSYGYNNEINTLKNNQEIGNIIQLFSIIFTVIICFLIARVYIKKRNLSREQLEDDYGYHKEAKEMDDFINGPAKPKKSKKNIIMKGMKGVSDFFKPEPASVDESKKIGESIDKLITKMDTMKTELSTDITRYVDDAIEKNIKKITKPVKQ
jgi:hypothetical protein